MGELHGIKPRRELALAPHEYERFCAYLEETSGLVLGEGKEYLLRSRLAVLLREFQLDTYSALLQRLESGDARLRDRVLDAMTTNETFWFREAAAIEALLALMPGHGAGVFRILSAGCSSGQEPYSISMAISEHQWRGQQHLPQVSILGVDLSGAAIAHARKAAYPSIDILRGLDEPRRQRFFQQRGAFWELDHRVRERVEFRCFNLMSPVSALGRFNAILCRNVLIYFAPAKRTEILRALSAQLQPGGMLFLGSAESLPSGLAGLQRQVHAGCVFYRRLPT